jgi:hypothetical protein
MATSLTVPAVLSAATETLTQSGAGYRIVKDAEMDGWPSDAIRVFEDPFAIVAVCVFDTWGDLVSGWQDAQGAFVELISAHLNLVDAKAWDGYLVLLTPGSRGDDRDTIDAIRYDTARVRKLVAAAPELETVDDIVRALLPLLPLVVDLELQPIRSVFDLLGETLTDAGVDRRLVDGLLDAFTQQRPLVDRLHELRQQS